MKRDMDLVRKILLELEDTPYELGGFDLELEGYSPDQISYHVMLLNEAGLIEANDLSNLSRTEWRPKRLTWAGHEFIEASRDESRWEKAKNIMKEKGSGMVFDVLRSVLIQLMTKAVLG